MTTKKAPPSQWYVSVGDRTVGPVTTELVIRGLESGKVPPTALICAVGASAWEPLAGVEPFVEAARAVQPSPSPSDLHPPPTAQDYEEETLVRGGEDGSPQVALPSAEGAGGRRQRSLLGMDVAFAKAAAAAPTLAQQKAPPPSAPMPKLPSPAAGRPAFLPPERSTPPPPPGPPGRAPRLPKPPPSPTAKTGAVDTSDDGEANDEEFIPVDVEPPDETGVPAAAPAGPDWTKRFAEQYEVEQGVDLPDEGLLLDSLAATPAKTLLEEDAMWNVTLCVALGSERLAQAAARAFFQAVTAHNGEDRIGWMPRALLSKGFLPSGIPQQAGVRGLRVLRDCCPEDLRVTLEREVLK